MIRQRSSQEIISSTGVLTGKPVNKTIKICLVGTSEQLEVSLRRRGGIIQETDVLPPAKGEAHLKTIIRGFQTVVTATIMVGQVDLYSLLPCRLI